MKQGKYAAPVRRRRRRNTLKPVLVAMAMVLLLGCVTGGTLAWLTDKTDAVVNTFTVGNIDITLTETWNHASGNDGLDSWQAQMIPGYSYDKDPVVTVSNDSEDCWLFVKFEEKNNADTYLEYTSTLTAENGWKCGLGPDTTNGGDGIPTNVWYRKVMKGAEVKSWELLSGNTVTVKAEAVTKDTMEAAADAQLVYTAYAAQLYKSNGVEFTAPEAWAILNPTT